MLLLGLERLFMATNNVDLVERFFIMNLLVIVVALGRKRMLAGGASASGRFVDNMTNLRLGGGGTPWQGAVRAARASTCSTSTERRRAPGAGSCRRSVGPWPSVPSAASSATASPSAAGSGARPTGPCATSRSWRTTGAGMIEPTFSRTWTLNKDKPKGKGKGGRRKGGGGPGPTGPGGGSGKPRGGGPGGGKRKGGTPTPVMRTGKKEGPRPAPTPSRKGGPKASPKMSTTGSPKAPPRAGSWKHKRSDSRTASPPYPVPGRATRGTCPTR